MKRPLAHGGGCTTGHSPLIPHSSAHLWRAKTSKKSRLKYCKQSKNTPLPTVQTFVNLRNPNTNTEQQHMPPPPKGVEPQEAAAATPGVFIRREDHFPLGLWDYDVPRSDVPEPLLSFTLLPLRCTKISTAAFLSQGQLTSWKEGGGGVGIQPGC